MDSKPPQFFTMKPNTLSPKKLTAKCSSLNGIAWRTDQLYKAQLLPRCMEVHCLQYKNCQYRYLWQYPSEMSNFFPDLYLPDWMTTKRIHHCPIT